MGEDSTGIAATLRWIVEGVSLAIELLAVAVIVGAIVLAVVPRANGWRAQPEGGVLEMFSSYKRRMGRGLLLGLELLLAADIVGTIAVSPTLERLYALALLALIRSFLSWSLEVEVDGRWPWQARTDARSLAREPAPAGSPAPAP